jgi:hypothetical protein
MPDEEASEDRLHHEESVLEGSSSRLNLVPEHAALLQDTGYESGGEDFELDDFDSPEAAWKETPKRQRLLNNCFRSKCSRVIVVVGAIILAILVAVFLLRDELRSFLPGAHNLVDPQAYLLDSNWDFNTPSTRREYTWVIEDLDRNPDGVYRPMMVINGQFPGPLIECNEGDSIVVHVVNKATNATSIHWHGLYQSTLFTLLVWRKRILTMS